MNEETRICRECGKERALALFEVPGAPHSKKCKGCRQFCNGRRRQKRKAAKFAINAASPVFAELLKEKAR